MKIIEGREVRVRVLKVGHDHLGVADSEHLSARHPKARGQIEMVLGSVALVRHKDPSGTKSVLGAYGRRELAPA